MRSIVFNFMLFEQQSLMMKFMLELMYSITKFTSSVVHSEGERVRKNHLALRTFWENVLFIAMAEKPLSSGQTWFMRWVFPGFAGYFVLKFFSESSFWDIGTSSILHILHILFSTLLLRFIISQICLWFSPVAVTVGGMMFFHWASPQKFSVQKSGLG